MQEASKSRQISARTDEKSEAVEEFIFCREDQPGSHKVNEKLQQCFSIYKVQSFVLQDNTLVL